MGRIDAYDRWKDISQKWLSMYRKREVIAGVTAMECVDHNDEWLCEAYMETDYSNLTEKDFQNTINSYLASMIKNGDYDGR